MSWHCNNVTVTHNHEYMFASNEPNTCNVILIRWFIECVMNSKIKWMSWSERLHLNYYSTLNEVMNFTIDYTPLIENTS